MTATQERTSSGEVGRDRRRKEDQRLITGRTRWTDNLTLPGMLHLAMVRSPFAHANITSVDVAAAQASPRTAGCTRCRRRSASATASSAGSAPRG